MTIRLPGGAWVFQSGQNIFFCHFQGQNFFFQTIMSQNIFFSSHTGPEYFFLYNTNKFGSNFSVEPQIGFKTIILRLSVCVSDRDDFKWHNIANSTYIAIPLYMRVYTTDIISYLVNFLFDLGPIMARHVFL